MDGILWHPAWIHDPQRDPASPSPETADKIIQSWINTQPLAALRTDNPGDSGLEKPQTSMAKVGNQVDLLDQQVDMLNQSVDVFVTQHLSSIHRHVNLFCLQRSRCFMKLPQQDPN